MYIFENFQTVAQMFLSSNEKFLIFKHFKLTAHFRRPLEKIIFIFITKSLFITRIVCTIFHRLYYIHLNFNDLAFVCPLFGQDNTPDTHLINNCIHSLRIISKNRFYSSQYILSISLNTLSVFILSSIWYGHKSTR